MKELIIYALISVGTVAIEKGLDKWVKHSKSTENRVDDFISGILRESLTKVKSITNFKKKKNG